MRNSIRNKVISALVIAAFVVPSHSAYAGNFQQARKNSCSEKLLGMAEYIKLDIFTANLSKGAPKDMATLNRNLKTWRSSAPDATIRGMIDQLSKNIKSKTKNGVPPSVEDSGFTKINKSILEYLAKNYIYSC